MFHSQCQCLFSLIFLPLFSFSASPTHLGIAKMPFIRIPDAHHTRVLHINQLGKRDGTVLLQKQSGYYCAPLITSSGSIFKVAVDSGSAYTWVGAVADNPYVNGFASSPTGITTKINYAGYTVTFVGETINDTVALGALVVKDQGIGVPRELENFPAGIDGVLGLGPTRLSEGISSDGKLIPTVVDNLYSQEDISSALIGVYFMPENVGTSGLLSFGYIRETILTSEVRYVPVTTTSPADTSWGIDATILYGTTPILNFGSGILDTGSDRISIINDAFRAYKSATGGSLYGGRLYITDAQYNKLQPLSILIGGQSYDLSPNAQIRPRSSPDGLIILVVHSRSSVSSIDFSLGAPFFQRYYVVFNSGSNEIGFASHIHTDSTTN